MVYSAGFFGNLLALLINIFSSQLLTLLKADETLVGYSILPRTYCLVDDAHQL